MIDYALQSGQFDPHWTELEYAQAGARDNLRIESLSETILADLLPGINNQTRRARYYSFWAWVLRDFILDPDATHDQAGLYEWLRRREAVLILAYLAHGCGGGAAGTEQGNEVWAGGEGDSYALDWKSLLSVEGGGYELYYRGVLQEMNIISRGEDSPHDDLTETTGLRLAEAYAKSVEETQYVRHYLDATRLRKADIQDFAQRGCFCQVRHHDEERHRLINAFFRFDTPDIYAVKRLASLCFFLDIIAQSDRQPLHQDAFRSVLYFWSFGDHHPYLPEGNLTSPAQRWRIFQLRQYFVFAVESFWSLFLQRIAMQALSSEEYLAWLLSELDLGTLAEKCDITLPVTDPRKLCLKMLYDAVRDAVPQVAFQPGPAALRTALNEQALTLQIRSDRSNLNVQVKCGSALLMLALIYWRCQPWRNRPGWIYVSNRFSAGRLPIESYLRHTETAFREKWTVARWLGWLHHRYVWLQHRRVTLEKLIYRGRQTAQFELMDNAPPDAGDGTGWGSKPRFVGIGDDRPKMNSPRFPSALAIMSDLGVVEPTRNSGYQLRRNGAALLARFRAYTLPEWTEPEIDEVADGPEEPAGG